MKTGTEVSRFIKDGELWYAVDMPNGTLALFSERKDAEEFAFQQNCIFKVHRGDPDDKDVV